jgi:hypothetical protein
VGLAKIVSSGECRACGAKSRKDAGNHFSRRVLCACFAAGLFASPDGASAAQDHLDYRVSHSIYGDIGAYSNVVDRDGETTTVTSTLDVKVSILSIVAYRRSAHRVETWMGDRLVDFQSTSRLNGRTIALSGAAQGDNFVLTSPNGKLRAPTSIHVANTWKKNKINRKKIIS